MARGRIIQVTEFYINHTYSAAGTYHGKKLHIHTRDTAALNSGSGSLVAPFSITVDGTRSIESPRLDAFGYTQDDIDKFHFLMPRSPPGMQAVGLDFTNDV
jgi:hypothetical protein